MKLMDTASNGRRKAGIAQVIVLIAITNLPVLGVLALAPVIPAMLEHFSAETGVRYLVPLTMALPGLCIALLSPLAGLLADRIGRRRLLLCALVLFTVCGMTPLLLDRLLPIIGTRFGLGIAESVMLTVSTALMGDYFDESARRKWLAIQTAFGSLVGAGIFVVSGALGNLGWRGPFWVYACAAPILLCALPVLFEPKRRRGHTPSTQFESRTPFPRAWMTRVCLGTLACALIFYAAPLSMSLRLAELGVMKPAQAGLVIGLAGLGIPVGAMLSRKLANWPLVRVMAMITGLAGFGLVIAGTVGTTAQVGAAMFVNQVGCGLMMPTLFSWCLSGLPFEHRGKGSGFFTSAFFLGQFFSPMTMIALADHGRGIAFSFVAAGCICLLATAILCLQRASTATIVNYPE